MNLYLNICNNIISFKSKSEIVVQKSFSVCQDLSSGRKPKDKDLKEFRSSVQVALKSLESLLIILDGIEDVEKENEK
jgi:hypothetical protein